MTEFWNSDIGHALSIGGPIIGVILLFIFARQIVLVIGAVMVVAALIDGQPLATYGWIALGTFIAYGFFSDGYERLGDGHAADRERQTRDYHRRQFNDRFR